MNSRITGSVLRQLRPHLFSTVAISCSTAIGRMVRSLLVGSTGIRAVPATWLASVNFAGTVLETVDSGKAAEKSGGATNRTAGGKKEKMLVSY
ncbi:putative ubiquinol oxidase 2, mitochondrial [Cocos nucifera]|uniref:Putative ubiquinol oxidase 2, mitochondrial n=1 Tax=Cocos nucifera TaxID=13894 RepID=A0A8K0IL31_COCNU|nr:putative ubiquinol oxidase 2, mitochondrial [Cocos nucifera]